MEQTAGSKAGKASSPRKVPAQARSRERYERMLEAAAAIIAVSGSEAMRMSEVAERAGVPIGSLYQFFPDKAAIIATLAERSNEASRRCIEEALAGVDDPAALGAAFSALLDTYYGLFLDQPVMRDIWSAMQSDKTLRAVQLTESRSNAALLAAAIARLRPKADPAAVATTALLVMHLGEEAMRLAVSLDREEGDRIVEAYKKMAAATLMRQLGP